MGYGIAEDVLTAEIRDDMPGFFILTCPNCNNPSRISCELVYEGQKLHCPTCDFIVAIRSVSD